MKPYQSREDQTRMRVLSVMAETENLNGWMSRREVEAAAYDPHEWRDLAVAGALGWLRTCGFVEDSTHTSGRYRITVEGRKFLARDELGVLLVGESDAG